MIRLLVFIAVMLFSCFSIAQITLNKPRLLEDETKRIMKQYKGLENTKGNGNKPAMRYLNTIENHVVDGKVDNYSRRIMDAFEKYQRENRNSDFYRWGSSWEYYGGDNLSYQSPIIEESNYQWYNSTLDSYIKSGGWSPGVGRINCIEFHPSDSQTYFVGTAFGGIWKTVDSGDSWTDITNNLTNISISDIAIEEGTPDKIYILTGDYNAKHHPSLGLYKSYNGGTSWVSTGLSFDLDEVTYCGDVKINPKDPSNIYVACTDGLYRSNDYGANFNKIYNENCSDIEFHPKDTDTVYVASICQIKRFENNGFTSTDIFDFSCNVEEEYRTEICVTPYFPDVVMCVSSRTLNSSGDNDSSFDKFLFSNDSGDNLVIRKEDTPNMMNAKIDGAGGGGQGIRNIDVECVPTDTSIIYIGGVNLWKSIDGGYSWEIQTHWDKRETSQPYIHADVTDIAFNGGTKPFICNDGGVFVRHWSNTDIYYDKTNDMGIGQYYDIDIMNQDVDRVIGALQDNGIGYTSGLGQIKQVRGADGLAVMYDHYNINKYYSSRQYGAFEVTSDNGVTWDFIKPKGAGNYPFKVDFVMHPTNSNIIFAAIDHVARTKNGGATQWKIFHINNTKVLNAIAIGQNNPDILYVSEKSRIWISEDCLDIFPNFNEITGTLPINEYNLPITSIAVNPSDAYEVYITCGGYKADKKVYRSTNGGTTWNNISTGLPNIPIYTLVYEDGSNQTLYVGTELGVYYSENGGAWSSFNSGLPLVKVNDIEINYNTREMYAGTWGRGIWGRDLSVVSCPDTINLSVATDPDEQGNTLSQVYDSQHTINSRRIIDGPNSDVNYNATNRIRLLPGFKAKQNSNFKAKLNDCN